MKFAVADLPGQNIDVFTTRIDTIYGASALILAPQHPLLAELLAHSPNRSEAEAQLARLRRAPVKTEDMAMAEKEGFFTGLCFAGSLNFRQRRLAEILQCVGPRSPGYDSK